MGYTHHWTPTDFTTAKDWDGFIDEVKKLHAALPKKTATAGGCYKEYPLLIGGQEGRKPFLGEFYCYDDIEAKKRINLGECVFFNGFSANENEDLEHETFAIFKNKLTSNFCKTARKPYDLFVCVCLIAAANHLKFKLGSDGDLADWKQAFNLYAKVIGMKYTAQEKRILLNKQ